MVPLKAVIDSLAIFLIETEGSGLQFGCPKCTFFAYTSSYVVYYNFNSEFYVLFKSYHKWNTYYFIFLNI